MIQDEPEISSVKLWNFGALVPTETKSAVMTTADLKGQKRNCARAGGLGLLAALCLVNALLQALFATMTTAIEFLFAFNFLVSHGILLKKQGMSGGPVIGKFLPDGLAGRRGNACYKIFATTLASLKPALLRHLRAVSRRNGTVFSASFAPVSVLIRLPFVCQRVFRVSSVRHQCFFWS